MIMSKPVKPALQRIVSSIDQLFFDTIMPPKPEDPGWFRCIHRRPSGVVGFTPNSMLSVLSNVEFGDDHFGVVVEAFEGLLKAKSQPIPFAFVRLHFLNVMKLNMRIVKGPDSHEYSRIYKLLLGDTRDQTEGILVDIFNQAVNHWNSSQEKSIGRFISVILDAWLLIIAKPEIMPPLVATLENYWNAIVSRLGSQYLCDIDEDVGETLLDQLGDIYANKLRVDTYRLMEVLDGINKRIERILAV
jgi:hypothetical protein